MNKRQSLRWESGLEIREVYTADDVESSGGSDGIGEPGEYPYTRGIHPLMYRKRPWTMRQYSGFGTAEETHERFLYLIKHGQTGLNVAFDLPTQCGLDSDDPMASGEVGRVGMAVDTLADMEQAFEGIDLNEITVSLTINGAAAPIMAMYFAMARKRGYDLAELRGTAQNDILKEFIGRGTWIFPVEPSVRLVGDTIEYCARNVPRYSAVSVCGYHIRESGATPAQEMAYGLAIARPTSTMCWHEGWISTPSLVGCLLTSTFTAICGSRQPNSGPVGVSGRKSCGNNTERRTPDRCSCA